MIDPIIERAINLFSPAEWKAIIWMLVATIATTHTLKILWRWMPIKGGGHVGVNAIAIVSGFIAAFAVWPETGSIPWYVAGVIAGPASSLVFKIAFSRIKKFFPDTAAAINADRRRLELGPPPATAERRKTDA